MALSNMHPLSKPLLFQLQASLVLLFLGAASAQLSSTFYDTSCPDLLSTVQSVVQSAVSDEARMGASLLRMHFHDCFVNGCDGSILLEDTDTFTGEQHSISNNNSIRGYGVIDTIKTQLESICPGVVSCADIVAVVARDSTVALGGPSWTVQLGRRDATTTSIDDANANLPSPFLNLTGLQELFVSRKGFTDDELVALSGAHTIGQARCTGFRPRIYNDINIDPIFAAALQENCPSDVGDGDSNLAPLDSTATSFDNQYFTDLTNLQGLLHSDQALYGGESTDDQVLTYSLSTSTFFEDFANAMVKMGNLSPLTGSDGEIRATCSRPNGNGNLVASE